MLASRILYNASTTQEDDGLFLSGDIERKILSKIWASESWCLVKTASCEPVGREITSEYRWPSLTTVRGSFLQTNRKRKGTCVCQAAETAFNKHPFLVEMHPKLEIVEYVLDIIKNHFFLDTAVRILPTIKCFRELPSLSRKRRGMPLCTIVYWCPAWKL